MCLKILIVGGSGNLGSKICKSLDQTNHKLFNLDKKKNKKLSKIKFINCNLVKKINIKKLPKDIDIIIFSAGYTGGVDSTKDNFIDKYFKYNLYSLSNLLESIKKSKLKKIIFFSSEQVYGDINSILIKNFLNEPNPKNYYGVSKLIAEKYLYYLYNSYNKKFGIDILNSKSN